MNKTLLTTAVVAVFALTGCQTTAQSAKQSTTSVVKKTQTTQPKQAVQTQAKQQVQTQAVQAQSQAEAYQAELARKIELSKQQAQAEIERRMALDKQMAEQAHARVAQQAQQHTNTAQTQYMYMCNMGATVKAVYDSNNDTAKLNVYAPILSLSNQDLNLKLAPSGSGSLYTNGKYEWHTKDGLGIFSAKGSPHQLNCEGDVMP
ncbi:MliC family protein [Moraxella oblonga]|uniref:MliC family protein n=1 Tax=Moraxella oblonga TaxID=200413 RepID=UPI000833770D|nr:MliC family protein [Moraxella oblonga]